MERKKAEALLDQLEHRLQEKDGKGLPASQRAVLYACLCDTKISYKDMPELLQKANYGDYKPTTLKTDGYTVFKRLSNVFGEDIKKKNCLRKLMDWHNSCQPDSDFLQRPSSAVQLSGSLVSASASSSDVPSASPQSPRDLLLFPSWQPVLDDVSQAIRQGHRVVSINGAAGVGKTYFTHALRDRIHTDFDAIVWCQASDVPTISHLYHHIQSHLAALTPSEHRVAPIQIRSGEGNDAVPEVLMLLRTRRILLVMDQSEDLYQSHQLAGEFSDRSASYETWLKRLLKFSLDGSCLIWVGREPPACFSAQYGVLANLQLTGLPDADAKQLLAARQLPGSSQFGLRLGASNRGSLNLTSDPFWARFVDFCGGNPAWLLLEATMMWRSHTQDILGFIAKPSLAADLKKTLSEILAALSPVESLLLRWLLLKPLAYSDICALDSPNIAPSDWETALTSLHEYRSLVTLDADQCYRLHPPLLRYVLAEMMVDQVLEALWDPSSSANLVFCACPLFHGSASAKQQQWLWANVVSTVAHYFQQGPLRGDKGYAQANQRLQSGLFRQEQIDRLRTRLMALHQQPKSVQGYGASNLLNLAIALNLPLFEFDMRGLTLCHVDLRNANISRANFDQCVFEETLLPLNLRGRLAAAMTPDGKGIAVGDATGALFYWQHDGTTFRLRAVSQLPQPDDAIVQEGHSGAAVDVSMVIETVLFQDPHRLIVVSHQRVYSWWLNDHRPPTLLTHLSAPVSCFTQRTLPGGISYVAVGLTNGDIVFWDSMGWDRRDRTTTLIAHRTAISSLAIRPDGTALVSVCAGNQGLIWDLRPHQPGLSYQEWSLGMNPCFDVGWTSEGRLRAEADSQSIRLRVRHESILLNHLGAQVGLGARKNSLSPDPSFNNEKTDIFERTIAPGTLIRLRFSDNGRYLSGSSISEKGDGVLFCWDWQTDTLQSIQQTEGYADILTTCEAGRLMLAAQPNRIQVFDLDQQELLWQIESQDEQPDELLSGPPAFGELFVGEPLESETVFINIQGVQGLSDAERQRLHMVMDRPQQGAIAQQEPYPPSVSASYTPLHQKNEMSRSVSST